MLNLGFTSISLDPVYWAIIVVIVANLILWVGFLIYARDPHSKLGKKIEKQIYYLDEFADDMSNKQKRQNAIDFVYTVLGLKGLSKYLIPPQLIGYIIDIQVKVIRAMQKATQSPDLHQEEGNIDG
ncbi:hypothetical protein [Acetonema longum]|uniref:Uncharacterized protein n=1 Tax=Acetonema longum DSM 6540 TaxID=1009370 RepID=F7NEB6_9FIRM|nr:hypothetical protein [Acetonema longum]EGO65628.1 hypothetical protein ALO_01894 [Acetonema longum DSM 6540]